MEITQITVLEDVELNNPIFIEALPGICLLYTSPSPRD